MLRKCLTIALVAAFAFTASACTKTGIPKVDAIIDKVQALTAKACGFVPYVETISAALTAMTGGAVPSTSQYTSIASSLCSAVTAPAAKNPATVSLMATSAPIGTPTVKINGTTIPVKGYFVR